LILPVVICLSRRLSHASLSSNGILIRGNCEWLIKSVLIWSEEALCLQRYTDNRTKGRANTCLESGGRYDSCWTLRVLLELQDDGMLCLQGVFELNHGNKNGLRGALAYLRCTDGKSALSPVDGRIEAYRGDNG